MLTIEDIKLHVGDLTFQLLDLQKQLNEEKKKNEVKDAVNPEVAG